MQFFPDTFQRLQSYKTLMQALQQKESPIAFSGLAQIHKAQLLYTVSKEKYPLLVVVPEEADAVHLCDDINSMAGRELSCQFPSKELVLTPMEGVSTDYEQQRISALYKWTTEKCRILIASGEAFLQNTIAPNKLTENTISLSVDGVYSVSELTERLIHSGYSRCEAIAGPGQFARRGDIFDIYPIGSPAPVRLEFWDDTIDSISYFEVDSQRRTDSIREVVIPPATEFLFSPGELIEKMQTHAKSLRGKYAPLAKEKIIADIDTLKSGIIPAHIAKYAPLLENFSMLHDYPAEAVFFCEYGGIRDVQRGILGQYVEDCKLLYEEGNLCRGLEGYYQTMEESAHAIEAIPQVYLSNFLQGGDHIDYHRLISVEALQNASWGGELRQLEEDLHDYIDRGFTVMLYAGSEKTKKILQKDIADSGIHCELAENQTEWNKKTVYLYPGTLSAGFSYPEIQVAAITQTRMVQNTKKRKKYKVGEEIRTLADIAVGDVVVHAMHGIGRFQGIQQLEFDHIVKDYIKIEYAGKENLYIPVTQMDMISKYIGGEDTKVKLSNLSSPEWQKARNKVKRAVKDIADQLIQLYAQREKSKGIAFYPDDEVQQDFEARFPYVETEDQVTCIEEIKQDMERERPMERLLCGDVGFGKTEVAFRAAMKCVLSGKQCAILVPTTVLALQHYQTACRRFEKFPVNIHMLSRFVPLKQQKEILKKIQDGTADIVIGTHRLVQKDIHFRALGLAIVDEEQRFGVAHKENFKEMFPGVDMLTLSATPIPRTLNMAMSGIRDMSVIAQPPQDRYPVQTYVMEYNEATILQGIQRELKRGGQVYYIHNRIDTIGYTAAKLQKRLPNARILYAHGRMDEKEMSEIWRKMMEYEADILVCTTIIETGVDIANVNTLVIENADRFGLSQLYQLRGRVGRSNRRAYAYFTFEKDKVLREESTKRLSAMREFTKFGSGFQIALRDLEIRGAGSLLGGQQHGHIESVGYDMYVRLLGEAVAEAKGEPIRKNAECAVDIQMEAHIPESYIESLNLRLDTYRKIATVTNAEQAMDLTDELIDRYGEPPKSVLGLIQVAQMRNKAAELGITAISQQKEVLQFYLPKPTVEMLSALGQVYGNRVRFGSTDKTYLGVTIEKEPILEIMKKVLEILTKAVASC